MIIEKYLLKKLYLNFRDDDVRDIWQVDTEGLAIQAATTSDVSDSVLKMNNRWHWWDMVEPEEGQEDQEEGGCQRQRQQKRLTDAVMRFNQILQMTKKRVGQCSGLYTLVVTDWLPYRQTYSPHVLHMVMTITLTFMSSSCLHVGMS